MKNENNNKKNHFHHKGYHHEPHFIYGETGQRVTRDKPVEAAQRSLLFQGLTLYKV